MELAVEKSQLSDLNNWQIQGPRARDLSTSQRRMRKLASREKSPTVFAIVFSRIESSFVGLLNRAMRYRPTIIEARERNCKLGRALDSTAFSLYIYVTSCSRPRIYIIRWAVSCTAVRIKHVEYAGTVITANPLGNYKSLTVVHSF